MKPSFGPVSVGQGVAISAVLLFMGFYLHDKLGTQDQALAIIGAFLTLFGFSSSRGDGDDGPTPPPVAALSVPNTVTK